MRQLVNPRTFGRPCIGLARYGCNNRPFYHITVFPDRALGRHWEGNKIEELGCFDPLPNDRDEKLVAIKFDRLKYWLGVRNAYVSTPVLELLGLAGLLPIHPKTILRARMNRSRMAEHFQTGPWSAKASPNADENQGDKSDNAEDNDKHSSPVTASEEESAVNA